jgi:hypothetical protein
MTRRSSFGLFFSSCLSLVLGQAATSADKSSHDTVSIGPATEVPDDYIIFAPGSYVFTQPIKIPVRPGAPVTISGMYTDPGRISRYEFARMGRRGRKFPDHRRGSQNS